MKTVKLAIAYFVVFLLLTPLFALWLVENTARLTVAAVRWLVERQWSGWLCARADDMVRWVNKT